MPDSEVKEALRGAADAFHKIGSALNARKLLDRDGHKLSQILYDSLCSKLLDPSEVMKTAADSFERCVRALGAMGADDVTIHECSDRDLEIF